ncbi:hypothetical protein HD554DRAFT_325971 [Boletus coccyginus]|nr:hypothetical protein HD554DRAFT_1617302 [Boletus coccyginus]KAI9570408.1 hypothetical protein HD554DRAFT_325971 [Boletus coccyginus]
MLYLVQDLQTRSPTTTPQPSLDIIAHFVSLVKAIERLFMAYTYHRPIAVLKSLFGFTLKSDLIGTTNWEVLKEAFEDYERSQKRKEIHDTCRSLYERNNRVLSRENFRQTIKNLLDTSLGLETGFEMNADRDVYVPDGHTLQVPLSRFHVNKLLNRVTFDVITLMHCLPDLSQVGHGTRNDECSPLVSWNEHKGGAGSIVVVVEDVTPPTTRTQSFVVVSGSAATQIFAQPTALARAIVST